jgi:hypothetical protein
LSKKIAGFVQKITIDLAINQQMLVAGGGRLAGA